MPMTQSLMPDMHAVIRTPPGGVEKDLKPSLMTFDECFCFAMQAGAACPKKGLGSLAQLNVCRNELRA